MNQPIEIREIEGEQAEELLVSDFGALSLVPTKEDEFLAKMRRVFNIPMRTTKRGEE